jgi:serine O-acetyltransferase
VAPELRFRESWAADRSRYIDPAWPAGYRLRCLLLSKEIWVVFLFRLGGWIYEEAPRALRPLLKLFWIPVNDLVQTLLDTHLEATTRIGPGLYIGHTGGIWINPASVIGSYCNIAQGVVVGAAGVPKAPTIGDRVWIGPHAVVTGSVKVGNEVVIGANSLVAMDVPDKASVVGVPAKVIAYTGSARLIKLASEQAD